MTDTPDITRPYILGIESSCDETAVALVTREGRVATSEVASQVDLHARYGGVVPEEAARKHLEACLPLVEDAMANAGAGWDAIQSIGVTTSPGLIGCLLVGVETAKALAWLHGKPLVAVNHLNGHLFAIHVTPAKGVHRLTEHGEDFDVLPTAREGEPATTRVERPRYPHVGLIVSGGHTSLVRAKAPDTFETLATTRDDAVGEASDKIARALGLGYPGGPVIDRMAASGNPNAFAFTPPMMRRDQPGFSFSGLKTAVTREAGLLRETHGPNLPENVLNDLCASFQRAATHSLIVKAVDALLECGDRDLVVAGGVACNRGLRRRAAEATREHQAIRIWFPNPGLCTDNAAMIAGLAWHMAPLSPVEALELNARATGKI